MTPPGPRTRGRATYANRSRRLYRDEDGEVEVEASRAEGSAGRASRASWARLLKVTEFGAANLHGKTVRQRAEALIGIAHPDFREDLFEAAQKFHYLDDRRTFDSIG